MHDLGGFVANKLTTRTRHILDVLASPRPVYYRLFSIFGFGSSFDIFLAVFVNAKNHTMDKMCYLNGGDPADEYVVTIVILHISNHF